MNKVGEVKKVMVQGKYGQEVESFQGVSFVEVKSGLWELWYGSSAVFRGGLAVKPGFIGKVTIEFGTPLDQARKIACKGAEISFKVDTGIVKVTRGGCVWLAHILGTSEYSGKVSPDRKVVVL